MIIIVYTLRSYPNIVVVSRIVFNSPPPPTHTQNDLLSSLLEATDNNTATDPPLNFDFDINPLLNLPTSPMGSDISVSETSHTGFLNRANSPGSLTSVSDTIGDSPANSPHNLATFSNIQQPYHSLLGVSDPTLSSFMVSSGMEMSESPTALSPDVRIDVGESVCVEGEGCGVTLCVCVCALVSQ